MKKKTHVVKIVLWQCGLHHDNSPQLVVLGNDTDMEDRGWRRLDSQHVEFTFNDYDPRLVEKERLEVEMKEIEQKAYEQLQLRRDAISNLLALEAPKEVDDDFPF